ncbi:MAG: TolC family protein [Candidatus Aureabacteria bacterium]|nr:TolC family protein [Candidatus Auribacterota bacterium]
MRPRALVRYSALVGCAVCILVPRAFVHAEEKDASVGRVLTLLQCYILSLNQMETIAIDAQRIKEAEAHFYQAMGILMPQVSFVSSDVYSHRSQSASTEEDMPGPHTYDRAFVFQQTLFSGFKDFALMNASRYEKKQRQQEKERAEQLLFGDVSDSFYLFLQQQEDLEALQSILQALSDRVQELTKRIELGRSRKSEVAMVRVQIFSIQADIETAKGQRDLARELLEFYVGTPVREVVEPGDILASIKPIDHFSALARKRADILAAENAVGAARENIVAARSGYLPTVNVIGEGFTARDTFPQNPKWDAAIAVNVPLFTGTGVLGDVKQAKARERQNELQLQLTGRQSQTEVLEAYTVLQYALTRRALLFKALDAAGENYTLQRQDYERNQVNNLDVLTAIQSLLDQKRNLIQASSIAKRAYWRLCVAAGQTVKDEEK